MSEPTIKEIREQLEAMPEEARTQLVDANVRSFERKDTIATFIVDEDGVYPEAIVAFSQLASCLGLKVTTENRSLSINREKTEQGLLNTAISNIYWQQHTEWVKAQKANA